MNKHKYMHGSSGIYVRGMLQLYNEWKMNKWT